VPSGHPIGTVPTATRAGFAFLGWFTEATGGFKIDINFTSNRNITVFAQWEEQWWVNEESMDEISAVERRAKGTTEVRLGDFSGSSIELHFGSIVTPYLPIQITHINGVKWLRIQNNWIATPRVELLTNVQARGAFSNQRQIVPLTDLWTGERFNITWMPPPGTQHTDWTPMRREDTAVVKRIISPENAIRQHCNCVGDADCPICHQNTPGSFWSFWYNRNNWPHITIARPGYLEIGGRRVAVGFHLFPHGSLMNHTGDRPGRPLSNQCDITQIPGVGWPLGGHMCMYLIDSGGSIANARVQAAEAHRLTNLQF